MPSPSRHIESSNAVDQDIQRALEGITMRGERSNTVTQFSTGKGGKFRNPNDPVGTVE